MPIIGREQSHQGYLPVPYGTEVSVLDVRGISFGRKVYRRGRPPGAVGREVEGRHSLHDGGLNLESCHGEYHRAVTGALRQIASARLPSGSKPVLTGELEFVAGVTDVRTNVVYGRLPWENPTTGWHDQRGKLTHVDIRLTDLVYIGTRVKSGQERLTLGTTRLRDMPRQFRPPIRMAVLAFSR